MSQVNELFDTMSEEDIVSYTADPENEQHIVIGKDRFAKVPKELWKIAVEGDHNIETVTFDCPRYWDKHDLTEMVLYIYYACPDGRSGGYRAQNVRVDDTDSDIIHFEWTISEHVTVKAGVLAFMVVGKKSDEETGESLNRWHSEPNTEMYISKGIPDEDIDYTTGNPDLLTQVLLLTDELQYITDGVVKTVNGVAPDDSGNVTLNISGGGLTLSAIYLLIDILQHANYTEDMSSQIERLADALMGGGNTDGGFNIADDGNGNVTIIAWGSATITDDGSGNVTIIAYGDASITDDGNGNVLIA